MSQLIVTEKTYLLDVSMQPKLSALPPAPKEDLDFILATLQALGHRESLCEENVLLTGATGFFGCWLTQSLLRMNDDWQSKNQLHILTRNASNTLAKQPWLRNRPDVHLIESDIRSLESDIPFTSILHGATAADHHLNMTHPEEMYDTIIEGAKKVIKLAEAGKCKRLLFLSSGGVYGPQPPEIERLPETYPGAQNPLSPGAAYGLGKRSAEFLLATSQARAGYRLAIARCFAFIGPYLPLDTHFAAGNFLKAVLDHKQIQIGGDGTPFRSYLYSADLVVWLLSLLNAQQPLTALNVGSDEPISIKELAAVTHRVGTRLLIQRKDLSEPIIIAQKADPKRLPSRYVPSTEKALAEFELRPWTPLEEAISKTLRWHLSAKDLI